MDGQKRRLDAEQTKAVPAKSGLKTPSSKILNVRSTSSGVIINDRFPSLRESVGCTLADDSCNELLHPHALNTSMAQVHSDIAKIERKSRASLFPWSSGRSSGRRSSTHSSHRSPKRALDQSPSKVPSPFDTGHQDTGFFLFDHDPTPSEQTELRRLAKYFLGFWNPPHAATALSYLEKLETKRTVRAMQQRHGCWQPPPEVMETLRKSPLPSKDSHLPDNKDGRDLKFILKVLGCSLHENKPYKQFLRAKSLRQKRNWLYKYQGPHYKENPTYTEPVCPVRLKRLYHFFPNRFTEEDGFIYFNNKLLLHDEATKLFYIGKQCDD